MNIAVSAVQCSAVQCSAGTSSHESHHSPYIFISRFITRPKERSLELTSLCLRFNPANYTTWYFRRQVLASLSLSLELAPSNIDPNSKFTYFDPKYIEADLEVARKMGGTNPKNYQIWYHRRSILEQSFMSCNQGNVNVNDNDNNDIDASASIPTSLSTLALVDEELDYIASVLEEDAKNYHAWSHRQWTLKSINMPQKWREEIMFINELLEEDVRNNSAWNQRWFVSHVGKKSGSGSSLFSLDQAKVEVGYTLEKASLDPYNESPWKYFIAIIKEQFRSSAADAESEPESNSDSEFRLFLDECQSNTEKIKTRFEEQFKKDGMQCTHLVSTLVDILEIKGDEKSLREALDLVQALETRYDPIRRKYWKMRGDKLKRTK